MPHVLIPLDGSELAEAVIPLVLELSPRAVTLLHVEDELQVHRTPPMPPAPSPIERYDLALTRCRTVVRRGRPAEEILTVARELGATLIAMTTHGRTGLNRLVLGSVAEEVVRASSTPVLMARSGAPKQERPILGRPLVGYDGSALSWRAVEALALLGREKVEDLTLLSVLDAAPIRPGEANELIERLLARQRSDLLDVAQRGAERARGLGFAVSALVRDGRPSTVLLEMAEQLECSLLAVATHGRSAFSRWIFGSVAEELLHTSSLPLLVTR